MLRYTGLPARQAWTIGLLSTLLFAASVFLPLISNSTSFFDNLVVNALGTPTLLVYAAVGAIIAARHPANAIGWIFCVAAFIVAFGSFAEEYARYALITRPGALPGGMALAWLAGWPQNLGLFLMLILVANSRASERGSCGAAGGIIPIPGPRIRSW